MERISREALNIQIAILIAKRGTCNRLQVGAVITWQNRIVGTGYNGPAKDQQHCNQFMCRTDQPCRRAVHAEINALYNIKNPNPFDGGMVLYCTHQPCLGCAIQLEKVITKVYYLHEYRDKAGIEMLRRNGIECIHINEQGEPIDEELPQD